MITIHFHSALQKFTNVKSHSFDVVCFDSLVKAMVALFPKLKPYLIITQSNTLCVLLDDNKEFVDEKYFLKNIIPSTMKNLWLVPCVAGAGKYVGLIIGIALIAIALVVIPAIAGVGFAGLTGFGAFAAKALLGIGINLILSTIIGLLTPNPIKGNDNPERVDNDMFAAFTNTVSTNTPLALNYGLTRIAGQLLTGEIKTTNQGF